MSRLSISFSFLVYCHLRCSLVGNLVKSCCTLQSPVFFLDPSCIIETPPFRSYLLCLTAINFLIFHSIPSPLSPIPLPHLSPVFSLSFHPRSFSRFPSPLLLSSCTAYLLSGRLYMHMHTHPRCTHIQTRMHACMHICMHARMHMRINAHTHTHTCSHTRTHTHTHAHMHTRTHTHTRLKYLHYYITTPHSHNLT